MNLRMYEHIVVGILVKLQRQVEREMFEGGIKMDLMGAEFDLKCVKSDSQSGCFIAF